VDLHSKHMQESVHWAGESLLKSSHTVLVDVYSIPVTDEALKFSDMFAEAEGIKCSSTQVSLQAVPHLLQGG
jgi:hypothetical protein